MGWWMLAVGAPFAIGGAVWESEGPEPRREVAADAALIGGCAAIALGLTGILSGYTSVDVSPRARP
jgi:hypothetical protein